jgi:predicted acetyltransferase
MDIRAEPIPLSEKQALWADLQDYIEGMTAYDETIERENGVYRYPWFDHYWIEKDRWPFWAMADGRRAGFGLVRREEDGSFDMAEFYIRPDFRRGGIGLEFARSLLRKFPGKWIISEYSANVGAVAFWRRVIEPYAFSEEPYIGEDSGKARLMQRVTVT